MIKPALDHIPPEILADMCWHLCSHCTNDHLSHCPSPGSLATPDPGKLWEKPYAEITTGLLSLARTCQVLNNAATPYIYHNIDARRWPEEKITEFLRDRRQLHKRSAIRRLTYELDPFPLYTLLCRMPGLQLLSLVDRGSVGQTLASKTQRKLHDVRYLHLESTHPTYICDLSTLENLLEMAPNIKTIAIKSGVLEWKEKLHDSPKVPLANLTCLKLFNVSVNPKTLEGILEKCGPLESFIYICQREGSASPGTLPFTLSRSHWTSLRYLECCWDSIDRTPMISSLLRPLKTFERLETLVLGGDSLSIGVFAEGTFRVKELDPTSLIELLPASIVDVRIDSKHLHKGMYQPMVVLCQAKQAGSFPKLRSLLQSNFDVSQVPYTLGNLSELSERYGVSFKQEASSVFPPPVARPQYPGWRMICRRRSMVAALDQDSP
ncbi:hypothetical protein FAGAP_2538 [Fusarium agapanthi]|uniref:F-box domain-containing protein n=1 Tax=Fusarium agapanthi TaxID=1803897 RepID=A0A9P5BM48_9HYPO|nr:hypothetical protein FAGAP_2538 [Fusarium agapanthi]